MGRRGRRAGRRIPPPPVRHLGSGKKPTANPVVLSPDIFKLTGTGPAVSAYRIDPRARADWQATLRTRTVQRQALTDGMTGLVATTEQTSPRHLA